MSKDIKEAIKLVLIIFSIILVYLFCFLAMYILFGKISNDKRADFWNDFIIMILSSVFSATVAYIVSFLQIKRDKEMERVKQKEENTRLLNLINLELIDNKSVLDLQKSQGFKENSDSILKTQLSFTMFNRCIDKIELPENEFIELIKNNKKLLFFIEQDHVIKEKQCDKMLKSLEKVISILNCANNLR